MVRAVHGVHFCWAARVRELRNLAGVMTKLSLFLSFPRYVTRRNQFITCTNERASMELVSVE